MSFGQKCFLLKCTFKLILMIPVRTETLEKSTALKISIFSENSFCILLIKLLSVILKDIFYYTKDMQGLIYRYITVFI